MDFYVIEKVWGSLIGDDVSGHYLSWAQMGIRAGLVFCIALAFIRLTGMRVFGEKSAFDVVVTIMLGAVLGRAVYGGSPFFPIIGSALVIVFLHRFLSFVSYKSHKVGILIKGNKHHLIENGKINWNNMRKCQITEHDLMEGLREKTHLDDLATIKNAYFERNGQISFVLKQCK
jgi:uncharacterized membrane protein YcaP (DUF421 family)